MQQPSVISVNDIPEVSYTGRERKDTPAAKACKEAFLLTPGNVHQHTLTSRKKANQFCNLMRLYIKDNGMIDTIKVVQRMSTVYVVRL